MGARFSLATFLMLAVACGPEQAAIYHYNLGVDLHETGQLDDAIAEYRKAIELDPNLAVAHNNLGVALSPKGQPHRHTSELGLVKAARNGDTTEVTELIEAGADINAIGIIGETALGLASLQWTPSEWRDIWVFKCQKKRSDVSLRRSSERRRYVWCVKRASL